MAEADEKLLGLFLKDRRARLDPAALGFAIGRRRTPGLRREEVAQRANVSPTWYTWLEQGRGGAPSAAALDRIAGALTLTEVEREHLFLLGLGRPRMPSHRGYDAISPQLQRVLDCLTHAPAYIKTACWDIIGWNEAAAAVLTDYALRDPKDRNILRMMFCDPALRLSIPHWQANARFVVAAFRAEAAQAGMPQSAQDLVAELSSVSAEFAELWGAHEVSIFGEGTKLVHHVDAGAISLEYATFTVGGRPELAMVIFNPSTAADVDQVRRLLEVRAAARRVQTALPAEHLLAS
jgi:transcriptional regulator with XRE-family HTH domain